MTDALAAADTPSIATDAERPAAPKPEDDKKPVVGHPEPALVAEQTVAASPAPVIQDVNYEIPIAQFQKVERHLATHIHDCLPQDMVQDMELTLTARPRLGKTDLLLQLEGKALQANGALATENIMATLKQHPELAPFFARHERPFERQPEGKPTTLEIIIPQLELGEYVSLMRGLSKHADAHMQSAPTDKPQLAVSNKPVVANDHSTADIPTKWQAAVSDQLPELAKGHAR